MRMVQEQRFFFVLKFVSSTSKTKKTFELVFLFGFQFLMMLMARFLHLLRSFEIFWLLEWPSYDFCEFHPNQQPCFLFRNVFCKQICRHPLPLLVIIYYFGEPFPEKKGQNEIIKIPLKLLKNILIEDHKFSKYVHFNLIDSKYIRQKFSIPFWF